MKQKKRKAMYLRKSRDNKEEEDVLKTHRKILLDLAIKRGEEVLPEDIYEEILSGDSEEKDEQKRMLGNIEKYDGILCMDIDRLSRNDVEANQLKQIFYFNDVEVITPSKVYNFENESDDLLYGFESLIAKAELKKIKKRLKSGKVNKFKEGLYTTGKPPIGYVRNPQTKTLEINKVEAEIVRMIFELSAQGYGAKYISDKINERGYRTQTGRVFAVSHIRHIQKNKIYIGTTTLHVYNKRGEVEETIENENSCPPIVSLELFLKANQEMKRRYNNKSNIRGYAKSPLSGLVKCGHCGRRMTVIWDKAKTTAILKACDTIYPDGSSCVNAGIKMSVLEDLVFDDMKDFEEKLVNDLENIEDSSTDEIKEEILSEIKDFEKRLIAIDKEDDAITDLAISGLLKKDKLKIRKEALEKESEELKMKIKNNQIRIADIHNNDNKNTLERWVDLIRNIHDYTIAEQNDALKSFIDIIKYKREPVPKGIGRKYSNQHLIISPPHIEIVYRK